MNGQGAENFAALPALRNKSSEGGGPTVRRIP